MSESQMREYRKRGLSNFQIHEVEEGFRHGLSVEQVEIYANGKYDHLQMAQIRMALEDGLAYNQISAFLRPEISADVMEHARIKIRDGNVIDETKKIELNRKRAKNLLLMIIIPIVFCVGLMIFFVSSRYIRAKKQDLVIRLKTNDLVLEYGDVFNPADYVEDYTNTFETELILPETIDTAVTGVHNVIYRLKNPLKSITETMTVHIVDRAAPSIILKMKELTLTKNKDHLDPMKYIETVTDEYDGDLLDKLQVKVSDETNGQQEVVYSVFDSSNNKAEEILLVRWHIPTPVPTTPPKPVKTPAVNSKQEKKSSNSTTSNSKPTPKPSEPRTSAERKKGSKTFWFKDGYTIDTAYDACVVAGSSHRKYSCTPQKNSEGLYVSYLLEWED